MAFLVLVGLLLGYQHAAQLPDCILVVDAPRCPVVVAPVALPASAPSAWVPRVVPPDLSERMGAAERLARDYPWRD